MNTISRFLSGIITIILGLSLIIISYEDWWVLFYGLPISIIGFFILFNKNEDDIEKIKGDKK